MLAIDKQFKSRNRLSIRAFVLLFALCMATPVIQIMGQTSTKDSDTLIGSESSNLDPTLELGTNTGESRSCSANPSPGGACPMTTGYWKFNQTHAFDILEIGPINLGDRIITTVSQARDVLTQTSTSDARVLLRAQLLAAMLNRANGSNPMAAGFDVDESIAEGQNFLATHPNPVLNGHPDREQALFLKDRHDSFNNAPCDNVECDDFVTGGGWILRPSGAKANFGVHGGIKNGDLWGGLNYKDHGTGMHVKSTSTTSYTVVSTNRRRITYNVTIDGAPGTAVVEVEDNGEPGRNDWFQIQLTPTGYFAAGDLGGPGPGGGNIQLHRRGNDCNPPPPPPSSNCGLVTIIKEVLTPGGGTSSSTAFSFTANSRFGRTSFDLVDDNNGPGRDRETSKPIKKFGPENPVIVTEAMMSGWTLSDIVCTETVANTTVDVGARTANIVVDPGEHVVCTFRNTQFVPSAAHVDITGRVQTAEGVGISRALVTVTNVITGESRVVMSSSFGYYQASELEVGNMYVVQVAAKGYFFDVDSTTVMLQDSLTDLDFTANPRW